MIAIDSSKLLGIIKKQSNLIPMKLAIMGIWLSATKY